jgi:hypothetical protein
VQAGTRQVEFRFVELTGQTVANPADPILDIALQAKVTGGGLASFNTDIRIAGEPESYGTLTRGLISNIDGTYSTTYAANSVLGRGGLARQYSYLAGINAFFNGTINTSAGTFVNGPDQEIGIIDGSAAGGALLGTPGIDVDGDNNPDSWSGNGSGLTPPSPTYVPLDPAIESEYFAGGQFVDVYRFRYTVSNFTERTLHIEALNNSAITFDTRLIYNNGLWGAYGGSDHSPFNFESLGILVVPAPGSATLVSVGVLAALRRQKR